MYWNVPRIAPGCVSGQRADVRVGQIRDRARFALEAFA
jgi:hypothetical protein